MKSMLTAISVAIALSLAAVATQGADTKAAGAGASSVAEMLQRKHDTELRADLVREGRAQDVTNLDVITARRAEFRREHAYEQVNAQLAKSNGADGGPLDARALECDPDALHVK